MDRLIVNSVIRLPVRSLGYSFSQASVCSFAFLVCSVVPPFAEFSLLFIGLNML